jgi:hypothetical protein
MCSDNHRDSIAAPVEFDVAQFVAKAIGEAMEELSPGRRHVVAD